MDALKYWLSIQKWINEAELPGGIPLDLVLHFVIGALLAVSILKWRRRYLLMISVVGGLVFAKEIFDYSMTGWATPLESLADIAASLLYPLFICWAGRRRQLKSGTFPRT